MIVLFVITIGRPKAVLIISNKEPLEGGIVKIIFLSLGEIRKISSAVSGLHDGDGCKASSSQSFSGANLPGKRLILKDTRGF